MAGTRTSIAGIALTGICAMILCVCSVLWSDQENTVFIQLEEMAAGTELIAESPLVRKTGSWRETQGTISSGKRAVERRIFAIRGDYWDVAPERMLFGRGISAGDEGKQIAVVDRNAAVQLFGTADAVGKEIGLNGSTYTIYGVYGISPFRLKIGQEDEPVVFIPEWTGMKQADHICCLAEGQEISFAKAGLRRMLEASDMTVVSMEAVAGVKEHLRLAGTALLILMICCCLRLLRFRKMWKFWRVAVPGIIVCMLVWSLLPLIMDSTMLPSEPTEQAIAGSIRAVWQATFGAADALHPWTEAARSARMIRNLCIWIGAAGALITGRREN